MALLSATIARSASASSTNLTAKGGDDYLVGNATNLGYKRKDIVTSLFGTPTTTWDFPDATTAPSGYGASGTDGKPSPATFSTSTMYGGFTSAGDTWTVTAPADTSTRTAQLYFFNEYGDGSVTASMSDGSVSALTKSRDTHGTGSGDFCLYELNYAAGSSGQTLTLVYTIQGFTAYLGWAWLSAPAAGAATFAANAAAVASAAGALTTAIRLAANASSVSVANGQLSTQIRMSAAAIAQAVATAAMATGINMDADAVMQAAAAGTLATQIRMIAAAAGVANASGTLGLQATLSATAVAQAAAAAGLNTQIRLNAQAQAQATASAGLGGTGATLAASASSISVADGQLFTMILLDADAISRALLAGGLLTNIQLDADAAAAVMATATLQVGTLLDWKDIPVFGNAWGRSQSGLVLVPARTGLNLRKLH